MEVFCLPALYHKATDTVTPMLSRHTKPVQTGSFNASRVRGPNNCQLSGPHLLLPRRIMVISSLIAWLDLFIDGGVWRIQLPLQWYMYTCVYGVIQIGTLVSQRRTQILFLQVLAGSRSDWGRRHRHGTNALWSSLVMCTVSRYIVSPVSQVRILLLL